MKREQVWWNLIGPVANLGDTRPARAAEVFDSFFPADALRYALGPNATAEELVDRGLWISAHQADGGSPWIRSGRDDDRVAQMTWHTWPALVAPPGVGCANVVIVVPQAPYFLFAAEDFTFRLAETVAPWHGLVRTTAAARAIGPGVPRDVLLPPEVAWINVWSAETCALLEFREEDERLFASVRRTSHGARVLSLTIEPLDLAGNPDHTESLRAVYRRFPRIGRAR
jgi:Family of unknown function (DUF5953)